MPIDLRPPERRVPRAVDRRSEDEKAHDERNERLLAKAITYSWAGATAVLLLGYAIYVPVAWVIHIFD